MSKFLSEFTISEIGDTLWQLHRNLIYQSDLLARTFVVPKGFVTDLASVPRIPIVYQAWGGRCHREAVVHDYLYRIDSKPLVSFMMANRVFLEAAEARGKSPFIRYPMFWGTCLGWMSYHRKKVSWDVNCRS